MARVNANKLYRIVKNAGGDTIRWQFYASDGDAGNSFPVSPTVVNLNPDCLVHWNVEGEHDNFAIGLMSLPVLEMEININKTGSEFNYLLKDPYRVYNLSTSMPGTDYISGSGINPFSFQITAGNVCEIYVNDTLCFVGFQKTTLENNYDSDTYIVKVEFWHSARVVSENIPLSICTQLAALKTDSDDIRQADCAYDVIFRDAGMQDIMSAACPAYGDYYYFIRLNKFYEHLNNTYSIVLGRLTRFRHSVSYALPVFDSIELYKQSYAKTMGRGPTSVLCDSDNVYFLGFISDKQLVERSTVTWNIRESFLTALENYQNIWDFYQAHAKASYVRVGGTVNGLTVNDLFITSIENVDNENTLEKPGLDVDYNLLRRTEAASVEKYDDDVDVYESIFAGSRSANAETMTILFNNNIPLRAKGVVFGPGISTAKFKQMKISHIATCTARAHSKPLWLAYYYFERPDIDGYLTTTEVPILYNHNFNIILGQGFESDDFLTEVTQPWTNVPNRAGAGMADYYFSRYISTGLIDIANRSGGSLYVFSKSLLQIYKAFSDSNNATKQQAKLKIRYKPSIASVRQYISGLTFRMDYNVSLLNPPNDVDFFDNMIEEFYITKYKIDLDCLSTNGYSIICEAEAVARSYE